MRHFPELATRAAGQYPLRRTRHERVVALESIDGRVSRYHDAPDADITWELDCRGLLPQEQNAITNLFDECEGRLGTFLFLDPAANLLRWSEDFTQSAWTRGPFVTVTAGIADPWGSERASFLSNSGAAEQFVAQTLNTPGGRQYCFSLYARGPGAAFRLRAASGGHAVEKSFLANAVWMRYVLSTHLPSAEDTIIFSFGLPPGGQLEVTGLQVDAQPAPGGYRITTSRHGIYPAARFDHDTLAWTRTGPQENDTVLRIVSRND